MTLRPYQHANKESLRARFRAGQRRVIYQCATGSGKTTVACNMIAGARHLGHSVAVIVHRRELVQQFEAALAADGVDGVAVHMAQTLTRRLDRVAAPRLCIVDECHHSVSNTWQRIIQYWPDTWFLGLTATPARLDGRGLGKLFQGMVCGPSMRDLIRDGYLAPYRLYVPPAPDTSKLRKRAGDYTSETLSAVFDRPGIVGDVVDTYLRLGQGRQFVAFGVTVEHARNIARGFAARSVTCGVLHGGMSASDRDTIVSCVKSGALQGIANCDIVSEGFDVPAIGCVILASKTASIVRYLQRVGRGLRRDGDREAIILDHGGNFFVHGRPDMHREWSLDGATKRQPITSEVSIRHCGACFAVYELPAVACPYCGAVPTPGARTMTVRKGELVEVNYWETATVADARTVHDLEKIREARRYHPGWVVNEAMRRFGMPREDVGRALGWHPAAVRRYGR